MDRHLADLHVHSTASDGTLRPEEVVRASADAGLAAVAIADHDTVEGIPFAQSEGLSVGVRVVPAVEINTDCGKHELHILGYYIDFESPALNARLKQLRSGREERASRIVEKLNEMGISITMDRVREIAGEGAVGRPHIARAIVEAKYCTTMNGAFGKYLIRSAPSYVPRYKLTPFEAIDIIHESGGVAVFAHPGLSHHDELIPPLVEAGLQGIEAYHSEHSSVQAKHYLKVAEHHSLIPTGGSDSHGPDNLKTIKIGSVTVDISIVDRLRELSLSQESPSL